MSACRKLRVVVEQRLLDVRTRVSRARQDAQSHARSLTTFLGQRLVPHVVAWSDVIDTALEPSSTSRPSLEDVRRHETRERLWLARQQPSWPQSDQEQWLQRICNSAAPKADVPPPRVFIEHDAGARWAARFDPYLWQIEFNGAYLGQYDEGAIDSIMRHELAHAWVHFNGLDQRQDDPHGPVFQHRARELGVS